MDDIELWETYSGPECEERILLQDDLTLLDLPSGEQASALARDLFDGEAGARGLVVLPVFGLTLLATVVNFLTTHTTRQLAMVFGVNLAVLVVAGYHLSLNFYFLLV